MSTSRFVYWQERRPTHEELGHVVEDYFAGLGQVRRVPDSTVWIVSLSGPCTAALRRVGSASPVKAASSHEATVRWIEVVAGEDNVDVITRGQDEVTCALANGLHALLMRHYQATAYEAVMVWRMASGATIPFKELDDHHLNNIIRMLDRQGLCFEAELDTYSGDFSHLVAMFRQRDISGTDLQFLVKRLPRYKALCRERDRRKREDRWSIAAELDHDAFSLNELRYAQARPRYGVAADDDLTLGGKGDSR